MKKALLKVAYEIATDLHKAGVIDATEMQEYKSLCKSPLYVQHLNLYIPEKNHWHYSRKQEKVLKNIAIMANK